MKNIKTFNEQFVNITNSNIELITENMLGDADSFNYYMKNDFVQIFEDVILNGTIILLIEGKSWGEIKTWLKDKYATLKNSISSFIKKIGNIINDKILNEFINKVKNSFKGISKEVIDLFDSMKIAVIKHDLVNSNNKPNFKKITSYIMEIFRQEKNIDVNALDSIQSSTDNLKNESLFIYNGSLKINENLNFVNIKLNEFKNAPINTIDKTMPNSGVNNDSDEDDIIQFNVDKSNAEGKSVNKEQLSNTGIGIFTKLLIKIGVNNPRTQVALTKLGMILMGIIISSIIALIVSSGGAIAITGTAGWAFTGASFSILSIISSLFFAFGVFLLMCWFRKPYPELEDYIEYLEAWFHAYPDGIRDEDVSDDDNFDDKKSKKDFNFSKIGHAEGFGKYDDKRLKKDDTCTLIGKWRSLKRSLDDNPDNKSNIEKIESYLISRKSLVDSDKKIQMSNIEQEIEVCRERRKKILPKTVETETKKKGRLVSYKDKDTKDYRTGVIHSK